MAGITPVRIGVINDFPAADGGKATKTALHEEEPAVLATRLAARGLRRLAIVHDRSRRVEGTTMGFGHYDHGALTGQYLVLREWRDGETVQVR